METSRSSVLVTAEELAREVASERPPVLLDVRWRLERPDGWDEYIARHIPRAVYVRLESELSDPWTPPTAGRHPLPSVEDLQSAARGWGVSNDSAVVVYDDDAGVAASRAWWLLRHAGFENVRLLDGGLSAWTAAGLTTDSGVHIPERGDVVLKYGALPVLDIEAAARFPERGVLLDVRSPQRYRGEVEPVDPVAGHIPGAINAPTRENLDRRERFLPSADLRARYEALGVEDEVAVYCGSGITASHSVIALTLAGFRPALYPGSWSEWSNDPSRPVAVGD